MSFGFIALCLSIGIPLERVTEVYNRFAVDINADYISDYKVARHIQQWWRDQAV